MSLDHSLDVIDGGAVLVNVAMPSLNQGKYLEQAIASVLDQDVSVALFVADGGSNDGSRKIIDKYTSELAWSRSYVDAGQSAAINEAIAAGASKYVCWLNSDDRYRVDGLKKMVDCLERHPQVPMVFGRSVYIDPQGFELGECYTTSFNPKTFSRRCTISQPATLIRRSVWEALGGVEESLEMAMDYDLWWRIYKEFGEPAYLNELIAESRIHPATKSVNYRHLHYEEAMEVVRSHYGKPPLIWHLKKLWSVYYRSWRDRVKSC